MPTEIHEATSLFLYIFFQEVLNLFLFFFPRVDYLLATFTNICLVITVKLVNNESYHINNVLFSGIMSLIVIIAFLTFSSGALCLLKINNWGDDSFPLAK